MNLKSVKQASMTDIDELLKSFDTSFEGLSEKQAQQRLKKYGYNVISADKQENAFIKLLSEFASPLVLLLFSIVIISFFIGEVESAIIIIAMIIINVFMTFFQEYQADKAAEKLKKLVSTTVTIIRSGKEEEISQSELVPGDIIRLSAGNIIPADIRIISSKNLYVNQSAMTGEALPVEKSENSYQDDLKNNIFDIPNICFMGTNVNSGTAICVVIATGSNTYLNSIADKITQKTQKSSFEEGVDKFVMLLVKGMTYIVLVVFIINALNKGNWPEALLFAIAVAVGLIPEMMPMIVTINLSKGALSLSRGKVIVKKLNSVQSLGAMDVLCSDKTGTLTQNKIILEKHIDINSQENEDVFLYAYINSYFQTG
ncbi:MAG TPA: magnesium-translocating P-type ATPase, partial [Cyanobacteria bacterium UBA9971]|nr:magnesium-translocating P-type ATPase [Cyanobacteria bacterium UBA9971]